MALDESLTVLEQTLASCDLKISEAKTLLARYLFREDDLERKVALLSGGEKVRLSFMILLFREPNFLILDEPTNHLDMESKEIIVHFLKAFEGAILVVSHDREVLNGVTERTLEMEGGTLTAYLGNYSYYKEKKELLQALAQEQAAQAQKAAAAPVAAPKKRPPSVSKSKLRTEIERLEQRIEELEEKIDALNDALTQPGARYSEIARELDEANADLEETMETGQEKSELLEEAQSRC